MHLVLPAGAALEIRDTALVDIRAVFRLQLQPDGVALGRGEVGLGIDAVLEFVHHRAVGQEAERIERVLEAVALRVARLREEGVEIRPGEKLHAHRVRLGGLHAAAAELEREAIVRDQVGVERVAGLVRHDVHVAGRAVEVCEDERLPEFRELRAVAAAPLVRAGLDVEGLVFAHHAEKRARHVAHGVVHLLRSGEERFLAAGRRVAAGGEKFVVIEPERVDAETLRVFQPQPGHDRHDVAHDVLAEGLHGLRVVAHALHAAVAELDEVLIAHLFGHPVAHVHEPVKNIVQLRAVRFQRCAEGLVTFPACGAVGAAGVFHEHRPRQLLAPEGEEHARHELGIFAHDLVLLDHVVDNLRRHAPPLQLHAAQQDRRERRLERFPERAVEHGGGVLQCEIFDLRADLVVIVLLGQIKRVHGVDRVAHVRQRLRRGVLRREREIFRPRGENFLNALRCLYALDHALQPFGHFLARHAPVGEFGYFHACSFPSSAASGSVRSVCRAKARNRFAAGDSSSGAGAAMPISAYCGGSTGRITMPVVSQPRVMS